MKQFLRIFLSALYLIFVISVVATFFYILVIGKSDETKKTPSQMQDSSWTFENIH